MYFDGAFSFFPTLPPVWGLGVDPSLQIDVLTELELGESTTGVRQVPGLHNGTKAFLFQGMERVPSPQCSFSSDNPRGSWPQQLLLTSVLPHGWQYLELRCGGVNVTHIHTHTHLPSLF